jgi:hypothetical protein
LLLFSAAAPTEKKPRQKNHVAKNKMEGDVDHDVELARLWLHIDRADFFERYVRRADSAAVRTARLIGERAHVMAYLCTLNGTPWAQTAAAVRARFDGYFSPVIAPGMRALAPHTVFGELFAAIIARNQFAAIGKMDELTPACRAWSWADMCDPDARIASIAQDEWLVGNTCPILADYLANVARTIAKLFEAAAIRWEADAAPPPPDTSLDHHLDVVAAMHAGELDEHARAIVGEHSVAVVARAIIDVIKADDRGDSALAKQMLGGVKPSKMRRVLGKTLMSVLGRDGEEGGEEEHEDGVDVCDGLCKIVAQRAAGKSWLDAVCSGWGDADRVRAHVADNKIDMLRVDSECSIGETMMSTGIGILPVIEATEYAFCALLGARVRDVMPCVRRIKKRSSPTIVLRIIKAK